MSNLEYFNLEDIDPNTSVSNYQGHPDDLVNETLGDDDNDGRESESFENVDASGLPARTGLNSMGGHEALTEDLTRAPMVPSRRGTYVAPWKKAKPGRVPDPFVAGRLRKQIELRWPMPPAAVVDARATASRLIDALEESVRKVRSIDTDQAAEETANQRAIAASVRAGKPAPKISRTDWASERIVLEVTYDETFRIAEQAVREFKRTEQASLEDWAEAVFAGIAPAHAKAREAVRVAAEALREWRAAVDAGHRLAIDSGRFGPDWHQSGDPAIKPAVFMGGLENLERLVESEDPVVSGSYLTAEDDLAPPLHTRQALNRKAEIGAHWAEDLLARIEAQEGFRKTQFTPQHRRVEYLMANDDREIAGLLADKRLSRPGEI